MSGNEPLLSQVLQLGADIANLTTQSKPTLIEKEKTREQPHDQSQNQTGEQGEAEGLASN